MILYYVRPSDFTYKCFFIYMANLTHSKDPKWITTIWRFPRSAHSTKRPHWATMYNHGTELEASGSRFLCSARLMLAALSASNVTKSAQKEYERSWGSFCWRQLHYYIDLYNCNAVNIASVRTLMHNALDVHFGLYCMHAPYDEYILRNVLSDVRGHLKNVFFCVWYIYIYSSNWLP